LPIFTALPRGLAFSENARRFLTIKLALNCLTDLQKVTVRIVEEASYLAAPLVRRGKEHRST